MACVWVMAKEGYKWTPTEFGKADRRIAAKFREDYCNKSQYQKKVPEGWVRFGWVQEVRIA